MTNGIGMREAAADIRVRGLVNAEEISANDRDRNQDYEAVKTNRERTGRGRPDGRSGKTMNRTKNVVDYACPGKWYDFPRSRLLAPVLESNSPLRTAIAKHMRSGERMRMVTKPTSLI